MEKISWIDRVKNGDVLNSLKEEWDIRHIIAIRLNLKARAKSYLS